MKVSLIAIILLALYSPLSAQSPVGKWKYSATYTESASGKRTDVVPALKDKNSCESSIVFNFLPNGKILGEAPRCPKEYERGFASWKVSGKKIFIGAEENDPEPETFDLSFSGNMMLLTKHFPDRDMKKIVTEFVKL